MFLKQKLKLGSMYLQKLYNTIAADIKKKRGSVKVDIFISKTVSNSLYSNLKILILTGY